jgi:membrane-associated phospholipid phosphatase
MCPIVLIEAAIVSWLFLDQWVTHWLYEHPDSWHFQPWLNALQHLGRVCVPIWLLLFWSCISNRWRPTVVTWVALLLVCLTVCPLKLLVHRPRPQRPASVSGQLEGKERHISLPVGLSFPSGDTATVFAIATVLSLSAASPWGLAFFSAAGLVGLLRVTALHHYPSDVMGGAAIGVLCGYLAVQVMKRWRPLDQFHLQGRWRIALGLLLIVMPLGGRALGMESLLIFLRIYAGPLAALLLLWLLVVATHKWRYGRRAGRSSITMSGADSGHFSDFLMAVQPEHGLHEGKDKPQPAPGG